MRHEDRRSDEQEQRAAEWAALPTDDKIKIDTARARAYLGECDGIVMSARFGAMPKTVLVATDANGLQAEGLLEVAVMMQLAVDRLVGKFAEQANQPPDVVRGLVRAAAAVAEKDVGHLSDYYLRTVSKEGEGKKQ